LNTLPERRRPFWKRHFRGILWGISVAGLVITIVSGFKFTLLFLPLIFMPSLFGGSDDEQ
jgi:hypothetical protein